MSLVEKEAYCSSLHIMCMTSEFCLAQLSGHMNEANRIKGRCDPQQYADIYALSSESQISVFENTTVVEQIYYANAPLGCHP
jgi:hypothetical protein